jgi:hypothetical protein
MQMPHMPFAPQCDLVRQRYMPVNGRPLFYDTLAGAYQALGGQKFSETQRDAYTHLHAGTWVDKLGPALAPLVGDLRAKQTAIVRNPELGRGLWRAQDKCYEAVQPKEECHAV